MTHAKVRHEKGIQTRTAQGRSTKIVSMIKLMQTRRLSRKKSLSRCVTQPSFKNVRNGYLILA